MSLLVTTMPVHTLMLILILVSTATAQRGLTCREEVPTELIRDLWSRTTQLIDKLPTEDPPFWRLLPKFCTKCPKDAIGWLELRDLINVYQRSVFSQDAVQKLLPPHYNDLLYRLQDTLMRCVSSSEPSKWRKKIKKMEKKIKKKAEGPMKAVAEFTFILRWIDELTQQRAL
ncbi:uncharacterized protein LOC121626098 [Scomber scombrus]|uniref:Uncharacterized protein LOC121626098 n=1 Tax=Scomber scombrus TaxID=13677 RepID=A0AAV1PRL9_SCOSC